MKSNNKKAVKTEMKLTKDQVEFLSGYLSAFDDVSDSAWLTYCTDAISELKEFKGRDPYDVWYAWVDATSVNKPSLPQAHEK